MATLKVITNVGFYEASGENRIIYVGKTEGGSYFAAIKQLVSGSDKWKYVSKTRFRAMLATANSAVASDFNQELLIDNELPSFVLGEDAYLPELDAITNGSGLPRVWDAHTAYALKGEGILAADIAAVKAVSSTANIAATASTSERTTTGMKLIPSVADLQTLFSNPVQFVTTFPVISGLVAYLVYRIFFAKGKKKLRLFGR